MVNWSKYAKTHKRIIVEHEVDIEYGGFESILTQLTEIRDSVPKEGEHSSISMNVHREYGYYDSVEIKCKVIVCYWVELTEEELEERRQHAAAIARGKREAAKTKRLTKEAEERKLYEKLREKFGHV
jgi:hypothetical protein